MFGAIVHEHNMKNKVKINVIILAFFIILVESLGLYADVIGTSTTITGKQISNTIQKTFRVGAK
jgi:hypothetical protein